MNRKRDRIVNIREGKRVLRATATTTGAVLTHRGMVSLDPATRGWGWFSYSRCRAPIESDGCVRHNTFYRCYCHRRHCYIIAILSPTRSSSTWTRGCITTNLTSTATTAMTSIGCHRSHIARFLNSLNFSDLLFCQNCIFSPVIFSCILSPLFSSREEFDPIEDAA